MTRPPPRAPLFPYTTLFRSQRERGRRPACARARRVCRARVEVEGGVRRHHSAAEAPTWRLVRLADRKSTRLNSSHVAISYAVFCLKKKTRQTDEDGSAAPEG